MDLTFSSLTSNKIYLYSTKCQKFIYAGHDFYPTEDPLRLLGIVSKKDIPEQSIAAFSKR